MIDSKDLIGCYETDPIDFGAMSSTILILKDGGIGIYAEMNACGYFPSDITWELDGNNLNVSSWGTGELFGNQPAPIKVDLINGTARIVESKTITDISGNAHVYTVMEVNGWLFYKLTEEQQAGTEEAIQRGNNNE